MTYTDNPDVLAIRLKQEGLWELMQDAADLKIHEPVLISFPTTADRDRVKFLIYSAFRLAGVTKAYSLKFVSPTELRLVPKATQVSIVKRTELSLKATATINKAELLKEGDVPSTYKPSDMSFLTMGDDELVESVFKDDEEKL